VVVKSIHVIALLAAVALTPWSQPLAFQPLPSWHTGASGTVQTRAGVKSTAWISNVRYRDAATADPPNTTLRQLPHNGVIVWAYISQPMTGDKPIHLDLARATHYACCDGATHVAGGDYDLTGLGPGRAYSVIVRVYFGSRPTGALRAEAQRALDHLKLPPP
jgi:hypothetical protein